MHCFLFFFSRVPDDPPTHSPPLSSFVERISMSSPSASFNDMDQPRSPSPEVVAQIPGAFTGKDKKFEKGREILRKLMIGMSKTLDETEVESPPGVAARGPKIIPLERESSNDTPDSEPPVDNIQAPGSSGSRPDPRGSKVTRPGDSGEAYNPEDEWSEERKKRAFRPPFMSKPPLSKEDLEELNRDLGAGSASSGKVDERSREESSTSSKSRHRSGEHRSRRQSSAEGRGESEREKDRGRAHSSSKNRLEIRKGESIEDAKRRSFEEWKKAEIERRKKRKAELKHSSHGKSRHDSSSRSSSSHQRRREHSQDHSSSRKTDRSASREGGDATTATKDKVKEKTSTVDLTGDGRAGSSSKEPKMKSGSVKDSRKTVDQKPDKAKESSKKADAAVEKVSEQLKKYSVQELVKTVHESLSPVAKKKELPDDLEQTFKCLVIRNLPPNTLRQDIFRLFHGFGIVELVLEVHFSFTCAGIAYAQLDEHSEAKRARRELADKMVHGNPVKIAPCADGIFREAKRTYEQTMNAREEQYAKRQSSQPQPVPPPPGTQYPHQAHASGSYRPQYPVHPHGVRTVRPAAASTSSLGSPMPGLLGYAPQRPGGHPRIQSPRFTMHSAAPRASTPPRPSLGKHNFDNPYNVQPGKGDKSMPSKSDPRRAAQMSYHEQKKQQLEKELEILRRHKEEKEKRMEKERRLQAAHRDSRDKPATEPKPKKPSAEHRTSSLGRKPVDERKGTSLGKKHETEYKAASLGKFKIPKLKKSEPETKESPETPKVTKESRGTSNVTKEGRETPKGTEESRETQKVSKESRETPKVTKEIRETPKVSKEIRETPKGTKELRETPKVTKELRETPKLTKESQEIPKVTKESPETPEVTAESSLPAMQPKTPVTCHQEDTVSSTVDTDDLVKQKRKRSRIVVISDSDSEPEENKSDAIAFRRNATKSVDESQAQHKDSPSVGSSKETKDIQRQQPEPNSCEGKNLAPDSKSTIESESDACEIIESDTDKTDTEQTPTADAMKAFNKKPVVVLMRATAKTTVEMRVAEEKEAESDSSKLSQESDVTREKVNTETSQAESTVSAAEDESEATTSCIFDQPVDGKGQLEPAEDVKPETHESEQAISVDADIAVDTSEVVCLVPKVTKDSIEPEECEYCAFSGKKIIYHYIVSHPGKPIPVKLEEDMLEEILKEPLGPGDDSAKRPLEKDLEEKLLNDDLSWIPPSLMFDYSIACLYCKFTALNKRHMLQHIADHLQTGTSAPETYSIKCRFCKIKNVSSHEMFDHISSHTGEYRYSCKHCGYKVFRMYYLKSHISSMHKGSPVDAITIEEADISNGWVYGYACKLCGYVQLHERNVKKHMDDVHDGSTEYAKINMCTAGPAIDISKKVSDAQKRKKADDEKRAASMPAPIEDMSVFAVGEKWLRERSQEEMARKADMNALVARYANKFDMPTGQAGSELLKRLEHLEETPMKYLEEMRQRALEKAPTLDERTEQGVEQDQRQEQEQAQEQDAKKDGDSDSADFEPPWDGDAEEGGAEESPPLGDVLSELQSVRPEHTAGFGYQVTMRLATALRPPAREPQPPVAGTSGVAIKQEPADQFSAESDARADAGLNSMNEDLESLMNDFDRFEREEEPPRPKLRLRKLSGDLLSSDDPSVSTCCSQSV